VENLSHSLIGATLAELALPRDATQPQRRLFFVAGIVAANLPDADLLYTRVAAPPLGYLLHHRGHTHTLVGCAVLGVLIWLTTQIVPSFRRTVAESSGRFWMLMAAALLSHLLADSWNSYGVHPFWPFDNRWYYGDSIFIAEPWFWVMLGAAAVLNTRATSGRRVFAGALILILIAAAALRVIPIGAFVALAIGGIALFALMLRLSAWTRSAVALSTMLLFVAGMFGLHHDARATALASLRSAQRGEIVDVVLSPRMAQPFCWSAVPIEKIEASDEYVVRGGEVALFATVFGGRCVPSTAQSKKDGETNRVVWEGVNHESLSKLRDRSRDDCYVRAWLQFGRVPVLTDAVITDARYGNAGDGGFAEMRLRPLAESRVCPDFLTNWTPPREDLLSADATK
jgi:inner membrane protein